MITFCYKPHKNATKNFKAIIHIKHAEMAKDFIIHPYNSRGWLVPSKAFQINASMYKAIHQLTTPRWTGLQVQPRIRLKPKTALPHAQHEKSTDK